MGGIRKSIRHQEQVLIRLCDEILGAEGAQIPMWQRLMVESMRKTLTEGEKLPAAQTKTLEEIHGSVKK